MNEMNLTLCRVAQRYNKVWGVLVGWDSIPLGVTFERAYATNDPASPALVSMTDMRPKFGPGSYTCSKAFFHRGKYDTYEISVPGHERILFHIGNTVKDTEGCILIGESYGIDGIYGSRNGFAKFMNHLNGAAAFELEVK